MIKVFNNLEKPRFDLENNNDLLSGAKIIKVWTVNQKIIELYLTFSQKIIAKVYEPDKTFQIIQEFSNSFQNIKGINLNETQKTSQLLKRYLCNTYVTLYPTNNSYVFHILHQIKGGVKKKTVEKEKEEEEHNSTYSSLSISNIKKKGVSIASSIFSSHDSKPKQNSDIKDEDKDKVIARDEIKNFIILITNLSINFFEKKEHFSLLSLKYSLIKDKPFKPDVLVDYYADNFDELSLIIEKFKEIKIKCDDLKNQYKTLDNDLMNIIIFTECNSFTDRSSYKKFTDDYFNCKNNISEKKASLQRIVDEMSKKMKKNVLEDGKTFDNTKISLKHWNKAEIIYSFLCKYWESDIKNKLEQMEKDIDKANTNIEKDFNNKMDEIIKNKTKALEKTTKTYDEDIKKQQKLITDQYEKKIKETDKIEKDIKNDLKQVQKKIEQDRLELNKKSKLELEAYHESFEALKQKKSNVKIKIIDLEKNQKSNLKSDDYQKSLEVLEQEKIELEKKEKECNEKYLKLKQQLDLEEELKRQENLKQRKLIEQEIEEEFSLKQENIVKETNQFCENLIKKQDEISKIINEESLFNPILHKFFMILLKKIRELKISQQVPEQLFTKVKLLIELCKNKVVISKSVELVSKELDKVCTELDEINFNSTNALDKVEQLIINSKNY